MDGPAPVVVPSSDELLAKMSGLLAEFRANPAHPALIGKPEGNPVQIRPAFPDAATFTEALITGVTNNAAKYAIGVRRPRADPKARALAQNGAWKAGVTAAVQRDAFAAGVQKYDLDDAIETAATLGAESYVPGVTRRRNKIQRTMTEVAPAMAAAVTTVRGMPATTDAEREARAVAMIRAARLVGQGRRGGR